MKARGMSKYLQHGVLVDLLDRLQLLPGLPHVLLDDFGFLVDLANDQVDLEVLAATDPLEVVVAARGALAKLKEQAHLVFLFI